MSAPALDWDQVRVFLAVAHGGQLAAAAEALGLDVSTVSRRLDKLEAELGTHLFDRGREGTVLTAAAEAMLPLAEEMERAVRGFVGAAQEVETVAEGVVRLAVPPGVSDAFVAPLLARFHQRYPRVLVELEASVAYADLTRREADLAVRTRRPKSGELVVTRLVTTRALPMASPAYAAELGKLKRTSDARWIVWGAELGHLPVCAWLERWTAEAPRALRTSHFASQLAAAAAGLGVVVAPEPYRHVTTLVPVTPGRALAEAWEALPLEPLWLVGHRALRHVPRVAALWDFLREELSRPEAAAELRAR